MCALLRPRSRSVQNTSQSLPEAIHMLPGDARPSCVTGTPSSDLVTRSPLASRLSKLADAPSVSRGRGQVRSDVVVVEVICLLSGARVASFIHGAACAPPAPRRRRTSARRPAWPPSSTCPPSARVHPHDVPDVVGSYSPPRFDSSPASPTLWGHAASATVPATAAIMCFSLSRPSGPTCLSVDPGVQMRLSAWCVVCRGGFCGL